MLFLLLPDLGHAKTTPATLLTVTPKVCVVEREQPNCEINLELHWVSPSSESLCLFENNNKIECWQQSEITFRYKAHIQVDTLYWLAHSDEGKKLVQTYVQVQTSDLKPTRRRLRSPWSFF